MLHFESTGVNPIHFQRVVRFGLALTIATLAIGALAMLITGSTASLIVAAASALGVLIFSVADKRQTHPFSKNQQTQMRKWIATRYNIQPSIANMVALTTIETSPARQYGSWTSLPTWVEHLMRDGNRLEQVRLVRLNGEWMLYGESWRHEFPVAVAATAPAAAPVSPGIAALRDVIEEVHAHKGMYVVGPDRDDYNGQHVTVLETESQKRIHLFWTDDLRAELWRGASDSERNLAVYHRDREQVLEIIDRMSDDQVIGLNWTGAEDIILTPAQLRDYVKTVL